MKKILLISILIITLIVVCIGICFLPKNTKQELPEINIKTNAFIRPDRDEPFTLEYLSKYKRDTIKGKIKIRGNYSLIYPKKSYTIDLKHSFDLCGLPHDKDFVLHANYIDKTFMRHKLSYDLFRQMNPKNFAPQCAYAKVSINKKPIGLYTIIQKIDKTSLSIDKKDTMAMIFKDPIMFFQEYIEVDEPNRYEQKYPKFKKEDKTYVIEKFRDFLFNTEDSVFEKKLPQWVDVDNVIDWFLLIYFTNNNDGVMKNFYFYKLNATTPFRFAVWDFDYSFGRDHDNFLTMNLKPVLWEQSIIFSRLIQSPKYRAQLRNRWFELRKDIFTVEHVKEMVEENRQQIKKAFVENSKIWQIDNPFYKDNNDFEQEVQLIFDYLNLYLPSYDQFFRGL